MVVSERDRNHSSLMEITGIRERQHGTSALALEPA